MVKRKLKGESTRKVGAKQVVLGNNVHSSKSQPAEPPGMEAAIDEEFQKRSFASEREAVDFLLGAVVSKLADDPTQQTDMYEFLRLLVDTDPELKQQLLEGALDPKKR